MSWNQINLKALLRSCRDGDSVRISVTDTGSGIPETDLPRIFERIYQVDKSRQRDVDTRRAGAALGLAIAYEIIRAHDGHIDVKSIVDVGTRFTVNLPTPANATPRPAQIGSAM